MIIAVASGKGGTGKTTVSASLVSVWGRPVTAVDLDVEAPNLHLFLKPVIDHWAPAYLEIPEIDTDRCTRCGVCTDTCQFKAIGIFGEAVLTFPEMCHGCGACWTLCPEYAISPGQRELGHLIKGHVGYDGFMMGRLRVGEAMSPPLIREVLKEVQKDHDVINHDVIIDAPPGVSCPAVNAVMDADVIVLVTEPTPFGLFDLRLAWKAFAPLGKPMGVIINRADVGHQDVHHFCRQSGLSLLAEIPFQRDIAERYARGQIIADNLPAMRPVFTTLAERITTLVDHQDDVGETHHA